MLNLGNFQYGSGASGSRGNSDGKASDPQILRKEIDEMKAAMELADAGIDFIDSGAASINTKIGEPF